MVEKSSPRAESDQSKRNVLIAAGVATGIGSAALVAALLYANRGKKPEPVSPNDAEPTD